MPQDSRLQGCILILVKCSSGQDPVDIDSNKTALIRFKGRSIGAPVTCGPREQHKSQKLKEEMQEHVAHSVGRQILTR